MHSLQLHQQPHRCGYQIAPRPSVRLLRTPRASSGQCSQPGSHPHPQQQQQEQPWQQKLAHKAVVGLSAAALGLALFQGRANAATSTTTTPVTTVKNATPSTATGAVASTGFAHVALDQAVGHQTLNYKVMQLFAAPVYGKLLAVLAVAAPILALGSILYHKTAQGCNWSEAFVKPYSVLLNCPGGSQLLGSCCGPAAQPAPVARAGRWCSGCIFRIQQHMPK